MKRTIVLGSMLLLAVTLAGTAQAQYKMLVTPQGGFCIDAKGGARIGAELVLWDCHGGGNQLFNFDGGANSRLVVGGLCAQAENRNTGAKIKLAKCDFGDGGNALQNFAPSNGQIKHNSGRVLQNGWGLTRGRNIILGDPGSEVWKTWQWGKLENGGSARAGVTYKVPGKEGNFRLSGSQLISDDGSTLVAAGAGNIVAAGAGNIVGNAAGN